VSFDPLTFSGEVKGKEKKGLGKSVLSRKGKNLFEALQPVKKTLGEGSGR